MRNSKCEIRDTASEHLVSHFAFRISQFPFVVIHSPDRERPSTSGRPSVPAAVASCVNLSSVFGQYRK